MGGMTTETEKLFNEALIGILSRYITRTEQIIDCKNEVMEAVEKYVQDTMSRM